MTNDELIEATARALAESAGDYEYEATGRIAPRFANAARAAIAVIAPAVLEAAANEIRDCPVYRWDGLTPINIDTRKTCADAVRALKARYV